MFSVCNQIAIGNRPPVSGAQSVHWCRFQSMTMYDLDLVQTPEPD
jgi:hypothetical protein